MLIIRWFFCNFLLFTIVWSVYVLKNVENQNINKTFVQKSKFICDRSVKDSQIFTGPQMTRFQKHRVIYMMNIFLLFILFLAVLIILYVSTIYIFQCSVIVERIIRLIKIPTFDRWTIGLQSNGYFFIARIRDMNKLFWFLIFFLSHKRKYFFNSLK